MTYTYERLRQYFYLMRFDKPIGTLLLLWPTIWALWLATKGQPHQHILYIFIAGVICMRAAGCIMNDYADRHLDSYVKRTCQRPLAAKKISTSEALILASILCLIAFVLVLQCNSFTIALSFIGLLLAASYPYLKRITHLPQLGLGLAFSWSIPMAFAAELGTIPFSAWLLFTASMIWPIIYDTIYAMMDQDDDRKIGIKSTAILFGSQSRVILAILQIIFLCLFCLVGYIFNLRTIFYCSLIGVGFIFIYQQYLLRGQTTPYFLKAFLSNNWIGFCIFTGIALSLLPL